MVIAASRKTESSMLVTGTLSCVRKAEAQCIIQIIQKRRETKASYIVRPKHVLSKTIPFSNLKKKVFMRRHPTDAVSMHGAADTIKSWTAREEIAILSHNFYLT